VLTLLRALILSAQQREQNQLPQNQYHAVKLLLSLWCRFENEQGRTGANAETLAGGFVRLVHGASTASKPNDQAGAMWFAELLPVGEGFTAEFDFRLSDGMQHCRVASPSQVRGQAVEGFSVVCCPPEPVISVTNL
jgi:hypothetical protein